MKSSILLLAFGVGLFIAGCTPKTTEEVQASPVQTTPPEVEEEQEGVSSAMSPCPKFSDAPDPDQIENDYVIYRDFLRVKDWERSFRLWRKVYSISPAADGRRNTVYADGIRFYEHFMAQTQDTVLQQKYLDTIFQIYDELDRCYPEGGYVAGRKAFDYFYKYPNRASKEEIYALFKQSLDADGMNAQYFVLNPFISLLVELYFENKIGMAEAQKYQQLARDRLAKGIKDCKGTACAHWEIIQEYVPARLEAFESVEGFYDCDYYMNKYYPEFEAAPDDCEAIRTVYSRLKWGGCLESEERFSRLISAGNTHCRSEEGPLSLAYKALQDARYQEAIGLFQKAADETNDIEKKAQYTLIISKIYNAHLKNFPRSRQYALRAAEIRPNWGEPYILIGRLYASSGPLCGPGRGWDSQIVTWPAIDMWNKAKRVDPGSAAEANKWINTYSQYMPNREDVFIRNLKAGDSYFVGCWIQESTTIRTSD
jgi:hypothetical protein